MPVILEPSLSDSWTDLWRKISWDFYVMAQAKGYAESLTPSMLDNQTSAMRKACYYTAYLVANP